MHRELAAEVVRRQRENGSWGDDLVDTSYAVLFLSRGRHPIFANKLRFGDPGDAAADGADPRAAKAAWRERKAVAGVYAVRCAASGEVWVGASLNIDSVPNGLWFALGTGGDPRRGLQRSFTAHGRESFAFEELERLPEEKLPFVRDKLLKTRSAHWRAALGASAI